MEPANKIESLRDRAHGLPASEVLAALRVSIADVADEEQMRQPNTAQLMTCANLMRYIGDIGGAES